jgi:hypothetical protein
MRIKSCSREKVTLIACRALARMAAAAVIAAALLAPTHAFAACKHWDLNGKWELWQRTQKVKVELDLRQDLKTGALTGKAHMSGEVGAPGGGWMDANFDGPVDGSLSGDTFKFVIRWFPQGYSGDYRGEIGPKGELKGDTSDVNRPQATDTWHEWAGRRAKCLPFDPKSDIEVSRPKPFEPDKPDVEVVKPSGITPAPRAGTDFGGSSPATPAQKTATAIDDVDIWDGAGPPGKPHRCGNLNCFLTPSDGPQLVLEHNADGWYRLKTNKVPPGSGWVAEDHLTVK